MRLSTLLFLIGATAAFPLLGLSALLWPHAQGIAQGIFVVFLVALACMIQHLIALIWTL